MVDLDNLSNYPKFDASGMRAHLHDFPDLCQRVWEKVSKFELPREYSQIDKVIILGMGGSAIGGEIVRCLTFSESKVHVYVHRDYGLPPFVNDSTLVIASSYSGETEETLSGFLESLKTPAKKLALTTGGQLKPLAEKAGVPVFIIDYRSPPRAAFPYSFISLLGILQKLGFLADKSADLQEGLRVLKKVATDFIETTPLASNPAKQLATRIQGHIPIVYGADILSGVAQRWKTQFNENSKTWAFYEVFPELNHNAVLGYEFSSAVTKDIFVILLHSLLLHPRIQLRYEVTAKLLVKAGISYQFAEAAGETPLAQVLSMVLLGDYTSYYLAILNEVDPMQIGSIDFLKNYLAQFPVQSQ